jgi:hypothetical protein
MSIQTKVAGAWKTVTQPWVKLDTSYVKAKKVFVKINGAWIETWPMQPGPVRSLATTTTYRNDRIEIDVDWLAPLVDENEPASKYIIDLDIGTSATGPFVWSNTTTVSAPTTAVTFTNALEGGIGFHKYAGKRAYVSIIAQSAAGRNGESTKAPAVVVAQLPPPPMPTSYTLTVDACQAHHDWNIDTGRRVTGVELLMQFNGRGDDIKRYSDSVRSADYETWNPNTIGNGTVTSKLRTYGPGGESAWRIEEGEMPAPVRTSGYRFLNGKMRVDVSGISPSCVVWYTDRNGPWHNDGERYSAAEQIVVQDSADWPRGDGRDWQMKIRPNNHQGWTGRDQDLGWIRKVPHPYYMHPTGSNTRRAGAWRNDNSEYQGATSGGLNTAYFFYSNDWFQFLSDNAIGYRLNVESAAVAIVRELTGGTGSAVRPRLMLHRAGSINGDLSHAGAYDSTALSRGEAAWCGVPRDWVEDLMQKAHDYRGLGMHHPNATLSGGISAEYMIVKAHGYGSIGGHPVFTVRVYHDG